MSIVCQAFRCCYREFKWVLEEMQFVQEISDWNKKFYMKCATFWGNHLPIALHFQQKFCDMFLHSYKNVLLHLTFSNKWAVQNFISSQVFYRICWNWKQNICLIHPNIFLTFHCNIYKISLVALAVENALWLLYSTNIFSRRVGNYSPKENDPWEIWKRNLNQK